MDKKGQFDILNKGIIAFIGFFLVVVLSVLLIRSVQNTSIVCPYSLDDGVCFTCSSSYPTYNDTSELCCNNTGVMNCSNSHARIDRATKASNATMSFAEAALLPAQFSQILVIVLIVVGVLGVLGLVAYGAYNKFR